VDHSLQLPTPDYEAADVLVVREPERQRALAHELRAKIVALLRERARSISDLAEELALPKGTVGHHVKVLEEAKLIHVVRTRKIRAVTEKFYGRTARLFVIKGEEDPALSSSLAAISLRQAADEIANPSDDETAKQSLLHVRLSEADAHRFRRRLDKLVEDFRTRETRGGAMYGLATAFYRMRDE
jgi:DNA-binding transcriptional ArsR family regulator